MPCSTIHDSSHTSITISHTSNFNENCCLGADFSFPHRSYGLPFFYCLKVIRGSDSLDGTDSLTQQQKKYKGMKRYFEQSECVSVHCPVRSTSVNQVLVCAYRTW